MIFKETEKILFPKVRMNRSLRILIIVNSGMMFVLGMFAPFYALFVQKIMGGSAAIAGLSWGLFAITTGLLTLFFTRWKLNMKEPELLIALGYVIRGVVFLSYAFMHDIAQLLFTQLLWGLAAAIGTPAFDAVYSEHTDKDGALSEWGKWEGVSSVTAGFAAITGGFLIQNFGYQTIFVIMAISSFFLAGYVWRLPREVL